DHRTIDPDRDDRPPASGKRWNGPTELVDPTWGAVADDGERPLDGGITQRLGEEIARAPGRAERDLDDGVRQLGRPPLPLGRANREDNDGGTIPTSQAI